MRKIFLYALSVFFAFCGVILLTEMPISGTVLIVIAIGITLSTRSYEKDFTGSGNIKTNPSGSETSFLDNLGFRSKKKELLQENKALQEKNDDLQQEINRLETLIPSEHFDLRAEQDKLDKRKAEIDRLEKESNQKLENQKKEIEKLDQAMVNRHAKIDEIDEKIKEKMKEVNYWDEEIALTEFGLYTPVYDFATSDEYKERLDNVRRQEKELVKNKTAAIFSTEFTLNGSASKGKAMMRDNVKQILRSFNNECDVLIDKVKFSNIESIRNRIYKSYDSLNKLNNRMQLAITPEYLSLKLEELSLAYEYALKKQEEKERAKEERELLKEQAKLQKEIAEERKRLEKERTHYKRVLEIVEQQLITDPNNPELLAKKAELLEQLGEIDKGIADVDYREANERAGYVYIISNIGSFGEDIYKIGMTRRLDPMERVRELGDASVPFNFDVHAIIFSDDAPGLENALHHAFEKNRLNWVNNRREFFHVKLEDIEHVVKENYDKVVEFKKIPEAQQYRESKKMREQAKN